jgi:hypothetical protein
MWRRFVLSIVLVPLLGGQERARTITPAFAGRKLALVIGNKSYVWKPLVNPVNDANAVAQTLREIGFASSDVHLVIDARQPDLRRAVREFVESVKPGDLAFVYYSGHGVEVKGNNYLLPIDLPSDASENYVQDEAVAAQRVLRDLSDQGAKVRVLILDACRDNPLRGAKSTGGGLAPMEGKGSLIVFSTEAGKIASDTPGSSNSVFTRHLVDGLRAPGLPLDEAMKQVLRNVARETGEKQVPAIYGSMLEDVVLSPGTAQRLASPGDVILGTWQQYILENTSRWEFLGTFVVTKTAGAYTISARTQREEPWIANSIGISDVQCDGESWTFNSNWGGGNVAKFSLKRVSNSQFEGTINLGGRPAQRTRWTKIQ